MNIDAENMRELYLLELDEGMSRWGEVAKRAIKCRPLYPWTKEGYGGINRPLDPYPEGA